MELVDVPLSFSSTEPRHPIWLGRFSRFVVGSILFLIFMGALVTSNYAGLSVPDWPATYGHNMFLFPAERWQGTFYEHSHRLVASGIGLFTVILAAWVWRVERRRSVRVLSLVALGMVCLQGSLGGLTVLLGLPTFVSASHGVLAQTFLCVMTWLAYLLSQEFRNRSPGFAADSASTGFRTAAKATVLLVYAQLIVAAFMRHTYSGIAIPDFPTMGGSLIPRVDSSIVSDVNALRQQLNLGAVEYYQVMLQLAHRGGAILVGLSVLLTGVYYARSRTRIPTSLRFSYDLGVIGLGVLYLTQFTLGVAAVLSVRGPVVTSVHVLVGASMLALSFLVMLRTIR